MNVQIFHFLTRTISNHLTIIYTPQFERECFIPYHIYFLHNSFYNNFALPHFFQISPPILINFLSFHPFHSTQSNTTLMVLLLKRRMKICSSYLFIFKVKWSMLSCLRKMIIIPAFYSYYTRIS